MGKMSPKESKLAAHRLVVLTSLTIYAMDEVGGENEFSKEFKESADRFLKNLEAFIEDAYNVKKVCESNYLQTLENKVEALIRREYIPM